MSGILNGLPGILDLRLLNSTYLQGLLTPGEVGSSGPTIVSGSNVFWAGNGDNNVIGNDSVPTPADLDNQINGMAGNDWIRGMAGNDTIAGGAGNDFLDGGVGNDVLLGGSGRDALLGGAGADTLDGGGDLDIAVYSTSNAAININLTDGTASGGHAQGDVLISIEAILASNFNDTIVGDGHSNILNGANGDDFLDGRNGNDILVGGAGNDTLLGGRGVDYLEGGAGADLIDGGDPTGDWALYSLSSAGVNVNLDAGTASGGDATGDVIVNISNLGGSRNNDTLTGDAGENSLSGNDGDDVLSGLGGDDMIEGGRGNDTVAGGAGSDTMTGGAGLDTFLVSVAAGDNGADVVTDFRKSADKLVVTLNGDTATVSVVGNDTLVTFGSSSQTILLEDVTGLIVGTDIMFV